MPADAPGATGAGRRAFLSAAGLATIALAAGCSRAAAEPVLKVANQKGTTKALLVAADALAGSSYAVEWSEFPAAQHLLEAVGGGAADLGLVGAAPFMFAYESGSPVKVVSAQRSASGRGALAIVVPERSAVRSVRDLRGRKIATTRGSIGHHLVLQALERERIPYADVQMTFLSPADTKGAFASGSIDAWSTWAPYLTLAALEGARTVADAADYGPLYRFEAANEAAIRDKPTLMRDFLLREARALDWSVGHPREWAAALSADTGLAPAVAQGVVRDYRHAPVALDAALERHLDDIAARFARAGLLKQPIRPARNALAPLR